MSLQESSIIQIKKCVGFIFVKQDKNFVANGTGFFVSIKTSYDEKKSFVYFVTANHVLKDAKGNHYQDMALRLNKFDDSSQLITFRTQDIPIFTHKDPDVDIAVMPCLPDVKVYDYMTISSEILTTRESLKDLKIEEGTEVLFTGLFSNHIGKQKNQPIVRFGRTALLSDEKIEWKIDEKPAKLLDLYLMECQSYGGNSGSPVFFKLDRFREAHQNKIKMEDNYHLAGVMTGSFLNPGKIESFETHNTLYAYQNIGIAAVTPSYKLLEILFNEQLSKIRKEEEQKEMKQT